MGKIRRGNYLFITWIGDHAPRHVHVFKDSRLVVKWDLDHHQTIEGKMTRKIEKIIKNLISEGKL